MAFLFTSKTTNTGKLVLGDAYSIAGTGLEQQVLIDAWSAYVEATAKNSDNRDELWEEYSRIVALRLEHLRTQLANLYHIFVNALVTKNGLQLVLARHAKSESLPKEVIEYSLDEFINSYLPNDQIHREAIHDFWLKKSMVAGIDTAETES